MQKHELVTFGQNLTEKLIAIISKKDRNKLLARKQELENQSQAESFWSDSASAQDVMQELGYVQQELATMSSLEQKVKANTETLSELTENDTEMLQLVNEELVKVEEEVNQLELATFLSGDFDEEDAIVTINAGTGGTEAMDWAEMLLRMYTRYFNSQQWQVTVTDKLPGPEAGISSVTLEVKGRYVYGYLKHEHGTHRLVRMSPYNAAGQRQTSFAGVEVSPLVSREIKIEIPDSDIEFQAVRSSGAGGQNVNKTSSAVRVRHRPTGILVAYSGERSQLQNRQRAMQILKAKLYLIEEEKRKVAELGIKGEYKLASWGNQIRNYVLQPYKLVKDTRTGAETSNTEAVLDGNIQLFIDAEVRQL